MILFGRKISICHKYIFKMLAIKFIGMPYCFRNSECDKKYGALRNVIPYMAHVKKYGKHMVTPQIGCSLTNHISQWQQQQILSLHLSVWFPFLHSCLQLLPLCVNRQSCQLQFGCNAMQIWQQQHKFDNQHLKSPNGQLSRFRWFSILKYSYIQFF